VKLTIDGHTLEVSNVPESAQEDVLRDWIQRVTDSREDG
jgi:hypothetical protein